MTLADLRTRLLAGQAVLIGRESHLYRQVASWAKQGLVAIANYNANTVEVRRREAA